MLATRESGIQGNGSYKLLQLLGASPWCKAAPKGLEGGWRRTLLGLIGCRLSRIRILLGSGRQGAIGNNQKEEQQPAHAG